VIKSPKFLSTNLHIFKRALYVFSEFKMARLPKLMHAKSLKIAKLVIYLGLTFIYTMQQYVHVVVKSIDKTKIKSMNTIHLLYN